MLSHAEEACSMTASRSLDDLKKDRMLELALVRLVEIIGEAAARINEETKVKCGAIPWPQIVGMRNRLVHGYDNIDLNLLWDTVQDDLPLLIDALKKTLDNLEK
ncbi:DUF86 domain-containing protein [Candidatus Sumerlaeota bacterium]|nr:DUF86 domain-containing protein [Candidatus Sumerlaeota bacterium]